MIVEIIGWVGGGVLLLFVIYAFANMFWVAFSSKRPWG